MTTAPSLHTELANAIRALNVAFRRLPPEVQNRLDVRVDPVEAAVNTAILDGDREAGLAAIRTWRGYWTVRFREAAEETGAQQ